MGILKTGRPTRKEKAIASVQGLEEAIRMNINIPKSFYRRVKQKALDEETTITEVVKIALDEYLSK